jgi:hypothetical protein
MGRKLNNSMPRFAQNEIFMPLTATQFEDLANELLPEVNKLASKEQGFNSEYFAQILISAIHSIPKGTGRINKLKLALDCIHRISQHLTFTIGQDIRAKLEAKGGMPENNSEEITGEEVPIVPAPTVEASATVN